MSAPDDDALLRHDTPVDGLSLAPEEVQGALARARVALAAAFGLEGPYAVWETLRAEQQAARARLAQERRRLDEQGAFLVGAVRAARVEGGGEGAAQGAATLARSAGALPSSGGAASEALATAQADTYLREGSARLAQARAELEASSAASDAAFASALAAAQQEVTGHLARLDQTVRPKLVLMLRALAGDRRILHVERLSADAAVHLAWVLTGKLPSRHGFAFDDSTDDVLAAPSVLYPEEGVLPETARPTPAQLRSLLEGAHPVLPMKGMIPFLLPGGALIRLLQRGPVMELELADAEAFRSVLTVEEAERIAGHFVALRLQGRLELELAGG